MSTFTPPVPTGTHHPDPSLPTGVLGPVHRLLADTMAGLHDTFGVPWGWTIVLLVLAIRLLLVPATVASFCAGRRLRAHAEHAKRLSERHGGDARRVARDPEYAGAGLGMLGPLVVQGVVLFALYGTLRGDLGAEICRGVAATCSEALSGGAAAFGPVSDLTRPGTGPVLVVLIALAAGAQALAVLAAPKTPGQPPTPAWAAVLPAGLLVPVGAAMPAGILVYWTASALIGLVLLRLIARWDGRRAPSRPTTGEVRAPG